MNTQCSGNTMADHEKFMRLALAEGRKSLAEGEFPVGCIMVASGRILAKGRRINSFGEHANELDHAEVVTLRGLINENPGVDCGAITVYSTLEPCLMCYSTLLLTGVRRIVFAYEDAMGGGTGLPLFHLPELYFKMQVEIVPHVLRAESLALFKQFFAHHNYWQDSLLARYTMEQK